MNFDNSSNTSNQTRRNLILNSLSLMLTSLGAGVFYQTKLARKLPLEVEGEFVVHFSYLLPVGMSIVQFYSTEPSWIDAPSVSDLITRLSKSGEISGARLVEEDRGTSGRSKIDFTMQFVNFEAYEAYRAEIASRGLVNSGRRVELGIDLTISEAYGNSLIGQSTTA